MTTADRVRQIVAKELGDYPRDEPLADGARLTEDLGADSLDHVELVIELEKDFSITIPDEDAEKLRTVGDCVAYVQTKVPA